MHLRHRAILHLGALLPMAGTTAKFHNAHDEQYKYQRRSNEVKKRYVTMVIRIVLLFHKCLFEYNP
jgi:hypothetical protein